MPRYFSGLKTESNINMGDQNKKVRNHEEGKVNINFHFNSHKIKLASSGKVITNLVGAEDGRLLSHHVLLNA